MIKIYNMDVMKALKQMPDESVDMQITSPPYYALRNYDIEGQIGLEPTFDEYIKKLCDIFDEVKRVLKEDGTCWVNLGDGYSGSMGKKSGWTDNKMGFTKDEGIEKGVAFEKLKIKHQLPQKCLIGIPERFMIEMLNRGWILRNKIIWYKRNCMPTSVKDRFKCSWEYLFFFSKSKKYYFDLDAVRVPHKTGLPKEHITKHRAWDNDDLMIRGKGENSVMKFSEKGKNPGDIIQTGREQELIERLFEIKKGIRGKSNYKGKSIAQHNWNETIKNCKSYRDALKILEKEVELSKSELKFLKDYVQNHLGHPKGKTPSDVMEIKPNAVGDNPLGSNPNDFWDITTKGYKGAHFAVFPKELVETPIKTTKKDAVIMDIFAGSGTTLEVARELERDAIGIEIKPEYVELIKKRLMFDKKGNRNLYEEPEVIK